MRRKKQEVVEEGERDQGRKNEWFLWSDDPAEAILGSCIHHLLIHILIVVLLLFSNYTLSLHILPPPSSRFFPRDIRQVGKISL